jgi:hypothetical protein
MALPEQQLHNAMLETVAPLKNFEEGHVMATVTHGTGFFTTSSEHSGPAYQAYRILYAAFIAAPLIAGIDKFFNALVVWQDYLAPPVARMMGGNAHAFMLFVGVVEIAAGIGVALRPRYFSYVVAAWLGGIIINLLMAGTFYDIALRDFGLALGALALARLAAIYDHQVFG